MHKIIPYLFLFTFALSVSAQDNKEYMMVMVKQKKAFNMARNEQDFQDLANTFERIANSETDQWHPLYYAGLCYINMSLLTNATEKKDEYLDQAQTYIDMALLIYPDESELYVLQALLYQARIQPDPAGRSATFVKKAEESLKAAEDYNPENPRVYYLMALNKMHSPEPDGGGLSEACQDFKTANEKFTTYRPQHVLSPTWGGERNYEFYVKYCGDQQ